MKKPKDVTELASRLATAAATPLVAAPEEAAPAPRIAPFAHESRSKAPKRSTVPVFLRLSQSLFEHYDQEAMRRTKATGRGVTVQQVILDRLGEQNV